MKRYKKVIVIATAIALLGFVARVLWFSPAEAASIDLDSVPIIVPDNMPQVQRETVTVTGGDFDLEAELIIPQGGRRLKPAVIFAPGSGQSHFHDYSPGFIETYIEGVFLSNDIAVLLINKRGIGASEGRWQQNDIQGRADDIHAAVRFLQGRPSIDASQIGVVGHSQGGWVASLAAAQHDDVAFFVTLAGPTTSVLEQIEQSSRNTFRCEGFEGDTLDRKVANHLRTLRTAASVGKVVPVGEMAFMAGIIDYDPREALLTVEVPGLLVFGEMDILVPFAENQARFDEIFHDGTPDNLTIVEMAQANHTFHLVSNDCTSWAESQTLPFSAELVDRLNAWLDANELSQ